MKQKYAPKNRIKDFLKDNFLIITLITLFLMIKVPYLFKTHNLIWDEAVYLGMGKYLFSFGDIGFWEIVRPIGLPLILGLIWKSGLNYVFFSELASILFATGNLILVYLIGKKIFNKKVGLVASFILAITSVFFLYTNYILTGIPSTFFVLCGIYIYIIRNNMLLSGILCGTGALFRFPQALILISFILTFFISLLGNRDIKSFFKKAILFSSGFLFIHLPFLIFNYFFYNKETSKLWHSLFRPWILGAWAQFNPAESVISGTLGSYLYNIFYYAAQLLKENTLMVFIIPGLIFIFRKKLYKKESLNFVMITLFLYFFYFTCILNKQTRFLVIFLPYAALIGAYGFYQSFVHTDKDRLRILIVIFVSISLIGIISRDLNYYDWRVKEEPPIVSDYYKFFAGKAVQGPILTTDPVPVAYADSKFIPFYFSVDLGYKIYMSNKDKAFAVIFSPESFYCAEEDGGCNKKLKELSNSIENENELTFSEVYGDRAYYIYFNKNIN
ncbi:glycosyltransferase family 39 protein [Candidatus Woesearchaeota archaeon]|nr:glycosyltransferase family 39 protein [Candidatus Woesearchaeota archaeon]